MKTILGLSSVIALVAVAGIATVGKSQVSEQPAPPAVGQSALPEDIVPGSPVAQVIKLVQAGVDASVIQTYVSNCPTAFNLDADKIIALTDVGLPNDLITAMMEHDKNYPSPLASAPPAVQPGEVVASEPPPADQTEPAEVTVNYFYQNLSPYGTWVEVDGYGRCWRPNIVVYDTGWRPYCDRGRWVYTDCGWYWKSDYSWGSTFHYGRWFLSPRFGWCWWPDVVWAPSWVTWRSGNDYCGWAPLPPFTVFRPGIGFAYRGMNVALSFDFGLAANCYNFVSYRNFCDPHPRTYCFPPARVTQIYQQTTVINNFNFHGRTIQNNGVSVTVIGNARNHTINAVPVRTLVNPARQHGGGIRALPGRHFGTDASDGTGTHDISNGGNRHDVPARIGEIRDARQNPDNSGPRRSTSVQQAWSEHRATRSGTVTPAPAAPSQITPPSAPNPRQNEIHPANNGSSLSPRQQEQIQAIKPAPRNDATPGPVENARQKRMSWSATVSDNREARVPAWNTAPTRTVERPAAVGAYRANVMPPAAPARNYTPPATGGKSTPAQVLSQAGKNNGDNGRRAGWLSKDR